MIEYLYNCIRATAGQNITVDAKITDDSGEALTQSCGFMLHDKNDDKTMLARVDGEYLSEEEMWRFTVPAEVTKGLKGRYWYCICHEDQNVCFKQPIYLV